MTCQELSDKMPSVVRGELSWTDAEAHHLADCADCRAEWEVVSAGAALAERCDDRRRRPGRARPPAAAHRTGGEAVPRPQVDRRRRRGGCSGTSDHQGEHSCLPAAQPPGPAVRPMFPVCTRSARRGSPSCSNRWPRSGRTPRRLIHRVSTTWIPRNSSRSSAFGRSDATTTVVPHGRVAGGGSATQRPGQRR